MVCVCLFGLVPACVYIEAETGVHVLHCHREPQNREMMSSPSSTVCVVCAFIFVHMHVCVCVCVCVCTCVCIFILHTVYVLDLFD